MDDDLDTKRKKLLEHERENIASPVLSQFFSNAAIAGPSRLGNTTAEDGVLGTQEIILVADLDDDEVEDARARDEEPDQVAQEDTRLRNILTGTDRPVWDSDIPAAFWVRGYPRNACGELRDDLISEGLAE